jgi:hypothetical protein
MIFRMGRKCGECKKRMRNPETLFLSFTLYSLIETTVCTKKVSIRGKKRK